MKKCICMLMIILMFIACSNNSDKAVRIADDYTAKHIIPLFKKAEIKPNSGTRVRYVDDVIKKMEIVNAEEKSLLDRKDEYVKYDMGTQSIGEYRNELLKNAFVSNGINAINKEGSGEGIYVVYVPINYSAGGEDRAHYGSFYLVVSKDMQIIGAPNIDSIIKNTDSVIAWVNKN